MSDVFLLDDRFEALAQRQGGPDPHSFQLRLGWFLPERYLVSIARSIVLLAAVYATPIALGQNQISIVGDDGRAVAGAVVRCWETALFEGSLGNRESDSRGRIDLPLGTTGIEVSAPGHLVYRGYPRDIQLELPHSILFSLTPAREGRVVFAWSDRSGAHSTGIPVPLRAGHSPTEVKVGARDLWARVTLPGYNEWVVGPLDVETGRLALAIPVGRSFGGAVFDSERSPVSGASVELDTDWPAGAPIGYTPMSATTNSAGEFNFSGVPGGEGARHRIRIEHVDYAAGFRDWAKNDDEYYLEPKTGSPETRFVALGRVRTDESVLPTVGLLTFGASTFRIRIDPDGSFRSGPFGFPPAHGVMTFDHVERLRLRLYLPGFEPIEYRDLPRQKEIDLGTIDLEPLKTVEVRVIESGGEPIADAMLTIRRRGLPPLRLYTDANGNAAVQIGQDSASIRVDHPQYSVYSGGLDSQGPYEIRLVGAAQVTGEIVDSLGRPLRCSIAIASNGRVVPVTWEEARFTFDRVPTDGRWVLTANGPNRRFPDPFEYPLPELRAGQVLDLGRIELDHGNVFVTGVVVDTDGQPIEGATISRRSRERTLSESDGSFVLEIPREAKMDKLDLWKVGYVHPASRPFIPLVDVELELWILTRTIPVTGRVVDPEGNPIAEAQVGGALTADDGTFELEIDPRSNVPDLLRIRARGYCPQSLPCRVDPSTGTIADIVLEPAADFEIRFVDPIGLGIPKTLSVVLRGKEEVVTLNGERALFRNLAPGHLPFSIHFPNWDFEGSAELMRGQVTEFVVEIERADQLKFLVQDESGEPIEGATLYWGEEPIPGFWNENPNEAEYRSDEEGRITVDYVRYRRDSCQVYTDRNPEVVVDRMEERFDAQELVVVTLVAGATLDLFVIEGERPLAGTLLCPGRSAKTEDGRLRVDGLLGRTLEITFHEQLWPWEPFHTTVFAQATRDVELRAGQVVSIEWQVPKLRRVPIQCFLDDKPVEGSEFVLVGETHGLRLDDEAMGVVLTRVTEDLPIRLGRRARNPSRFGSSRLIGELIDTQVIPSGHPDTERLELHFHSSPLAGRLVDARGAGLSSAVISVDSMKHLLATDKDGYFEGGTISPGPHQIHAQLPSGFILPESTYTAGPDGFGTIQAIESVDREIEFTSRSGLPIGAKSLSIWYLVGETRVKANGHFDRGTWTLPNRSAGWVRVVSQKRGGVPIDVSWIPLDELTDSPSATQVHGRPAGTVSVLPKGTPYAVTSTTMSLPKNAGPILPEGNYTITATVGGESRTREVIVVRDETIVVDFALPSEEGVGH